MGSKYLKDVEARKTKIIHVYPNGDSYARATFIVLRQLEQKDLERIIKAIEEKVRLPLNRPIRKLFEMSGVLVKSYIQIEDGKYYVAASAENFFPLEYGHGLEWVMVGPVRTSKYANVRFVTRSEEEGPPKCLTSSTNVLSSTKDTKERLSSKKSPIRKSPASLKKEDKQRTPKQIMAASEHVDSLPSYDQVNHPALEVDFERQGISDENKNVIEDNHSPDIVQHMPYEKKEDEHKEECPKNDDDKHHLSKKEIEDEYYNEDNANELRESKEEPMAEKNGYQSKNEDKEGDSYHNKHEDKEEDSYHNKHDDKEEDSLNVRESKDECKEEEKNDIQEITDENNAKNGLNTDERRHYVENDEEVVMKEVSPDDAASKIQAAFRAHSTRSHLKGKEQNDTEQNAVDDNSDISEEINSQQEVL